MNQRPPVYDPGRGPNRAMKVVGMVAAAVCCLCGLAFVAFVIALVISLNSYGSSK